MYLDMNFILSGYFFFFNDFSNCSRRHNILNTSFSNKLSQAVCYINPEMTLNLDAGSPLASAVKYFPYVCTKLRGLMQ